MGLLLGDCWAPLSEKCALWFAVRGFRQAGLPALSASQPRYRDRIYHRVKNVDSMARCVVILLAFRPPPPRFGWSNSVAISAAARKTSLCTVPCKMPQQ